MTFNRKRSLLKNPFSGKNWEKNIKQVSVEPCDSQEDPLGYRAVFFVDEAEKQDGFNNSFAIGASYLAKRGQNLAKAGYQAPMTQKAIAIIEGEIGSSLSGLPA